MRLIFIKEGKTAYIVGYQGDREFEDRFFRLGIIKGNAITLRKRRGQTLVVETGGRLLSVRRETAELIEVSDE